jgi:hypothetical protein
MAYKNIRIKTKYYTEIEAQALKDNRSVANMLETIYLEHKQLKSNLNTKVKISG